MAICEKLVDKLPLELQEMMYEYIVPGRSIIVNDPAQRSDIDYDPVTGHITAVPPDLPARLKRLSFYPRPSVDASKTWTPTPHSFPYQPSSDIVGELLAQELQDYFYRHARFHLGHMHGSHDAEYVARHIKTEDSGGPPLRKISVTVKLHYLGYSRGHFDDARNLVQASRFACLDGLANISGNSIDLTVIVNGSRSQTSSWMGVALRTLATEEAFEEALCMVFPRLVALEKQGYKTSLVVDAKYATRKGWENLLEVQDFEYVFTPTNATFTPEGYMEKMREYIRRGKDGK